MGDPAGRREELARILQALRESDARLRAVVETAVDAILTLDESGRVESANPAAEAMFGYTGDELVGRDIRVLVYGEEEYAAYLGDFLQGGVKRWIGQSRELRGRRSDGMPFPMSLSVSDVRVGTRNLFTIIARDLTHQRFLEREVIEASAREQQRIGHDLHDGLSQELTGIASLASVLKRELMRKTRCGDQALEAAEICRLANHAVAHARALVQSLCPVRLEEEGLMIALTELCEAIDQTTGMTCEFACPVEVLIHDHDTARHLYAIATSAVGEAIKRRGALWARVSLQAEPSGRGILTVEDNGLAGPRPNGGPLDPLHIIRYRARLIGGSIYVRNRDGGGTALACSFDYPQHPSPRTEHHDHDHTDSHAYAQGGDPQAR